MTSTSFNIGLGDGTKVSSRVLRPPGGGHTDIFGAEPIPPPKKINPQQISVLGMVDEKPAPVPEPPREQLAKVEPTNGNATNGSSSQEPSIKEPAKQEPQRVEPPKRVRVPPGGFSSGLW